MASMFKLSTSFQNRLDRERHNEAARDKISSFLKEDQRAFIGHKLEDPPYQYPVINEQDAFQKRERLREAYDFIQDDDLWVPEPPNTEEEAKREHEMLRKVVQDSPELRDLRAKLLLAEMNMERRRQLEEKKLVEMEESSRNQQFHKLMQDELDKAARREQERLCKIQREKMETVMTMKEQLHEKELQKERDWDRRIEEHKEMNQLIMKLDEEREAEAASKKKKQAETMNFVANYLESRAKEKEAEARQQKEEEEEMLRYRALQDQRAADKADKDREKKEKEEKVLAMLSAGKEEETRQREEFERMLNDLYFEEAEERYRKNAEEQRIRREQVKENLKASREHDHYLKEQRKLKEKAEREAFHKKMMDQMAEQHKIDQLNAQKRRMKMEEFKREIDRMWDEKKNMFHEQVDEAKDWRRKEEEMQAKRKAVIEEERQKLLASQGRRLAQFLPKGTLESEQDYNIVGIPRPTAQKKRMG